MQLRAELGEGIKVSTAHRVCKRVGRSVDVSNLSDRGEAPEGREGDEAQVHELHQRSARRVAREHEGGGKGVRERQASAAKSAESEITMFGVSGRGRRVIGILTISTEVDEETQNN